MDLAPIIVEVEDVIHLPTRTTAYNQLQRVEEFKRAVRELFVEGHDYGVIPGTGNKPTLLKPGAEKLIKLLGLADQYDFLEKTEEWDQGFFNYTVRCRLVSMQTGQIVAEGLGNCNSWESKYRWRWAFASEVPQHDRVGRKTKEINTKNGKATQYRMENEDIASSVNTILKMAKKRAQMDAALSAGRLSDVFTQDMEDITENRRAAAGEPSDYSPPPEAPAAEAKPVFTAPPPATDTIQMATPKTMERYQTALKALAGEKVDTAKYEIDMGLASEAKVQELLDQMRDAYRVASATPKAATPPAEPIEAGASA